MQGIEEQLGRVQLDDCAGLFCQADGLCCVQGIEEQLGRVQLARSLCRAVLSSRRLVLCAGYRGTAGQGAARRLCRAVLSS